ncbi:MAG: glycosyltransferase family 9 protein [Candidatus Omnitrophota bacterium]|nr:glycosyltransferase family 9 protein [Candidatus Omnitrophota bacterium]
MAMTIDKDLIKRILVRTLSNIGDIILTTPVIRVLSKEFPGSRMDVMVGPRGREIFDKDPRIFKLIIYDKHGSIIQKRRLQLKLRKLKYDLVVDLRNTVLPFFLAPKYRTSPIQSFPKNIIHKRERHLYRLHSFGIQNLSEGSYIHIPKEDEDYVENLLKTNAISGPIVIVNPGAKSHLKRWTVSGFAEVCDDLVSECGAEIVFVGMGEDKDIVLSITKRMKNKYYNFVDRTNIRQLAGLIKSSRLLITNDSAPLHLGCAVGAKVLAIFGPTDPKKYGPTGEFDEVISKKLFCSPCEEAACKYGHECMKLISADEVLDAAKMGIEGYE